MAGMKRFVTYIYAYENKKKSNNIGFAKIEIRGEDCRIEIHLRGVYARQSACKVYLFQEDAGDIVGHSLGEMKLFNGNGDFAVLIKADKITDSGFGINDMDGIVILSEDKRIFMSRWKEGVAPEADIERFRVWQEIEHSEEENQIITQAGEQHTKEQETVLSQPAENEQQMQETKSEQAQAVGGGAQNIEEENVHATEIPMRNIFPAYDWQAVWEVLTERHPVYTPFADRKTVCIQIELKELRELPKRYWYLGNNSFLLHGFFNYQYLVIGKTEEGRWFIGVPGIYQRQERVMATIFGFPEFIELYTEENQENGEPFNHMGCWYRYIEE